MYIFKMLKIIIDFILSFVLICIWKQKLLGWVFTTSDVSSNVNLDKILKFDLGSKYLGCIWTSLNYFNYFQIYVFL
jgi:hypothetical protein